MTVARAWNFWTSVYLHTDHLGSPAAATDASANLQWREDYTPYGEARQMPWPNDDQSGFTGHIHDADTGLTYMQARYYDPVIGRFLSEDPVGFAQGGAGYFNRYAYVANDPVNNIDPNGQERLGIFAGGELAYKAGVRFQVDLSFDTESYEINLEARVGAGLGARAAFSAGGFTEPSQTNGNSISGAVSVQAGAAGELHPAPVGGELSGKLTIVEGAASTENGFTGDAFVSENTSSGSVGPFTVRSNRVEAALGFDAGASATVDVEAAASLSIAPVVEFFMKDQ